ncbi:hypothetical protein D9758_003034 [Tetrapyrgos nigripes]|uniref:1-phosphatidylinositol-4-phosphate 5-kinase n=1 Tax=Tetrapyrgos nigripes TaxID=182062 RepID=A0A8H5GPG7_9AGAR|nr:hypothetical protein D9758_003034 [Tetrapyrgos nigripes]
MSSILSDSRRQSALSESDTDPLSSSAASFKTAQTVSRSSSQQTLPPMNSVHPIYKPLPTPEPLQLDTSDSRIKNVIPPALPSPPASDDGEDETYMERERELELERLQKEKEKESLSRPSQSEPINTGRISPPNTTQRPSVETIRADGASKPSPTDYLQPPPMSSHAPHHRPHRRNTTGSTSRAGAVSSAAAAGPGAGRSLHTQYASQPHSHNSTSLVLDKSELTADPEPQVDGTMTDDDIQTSIQMHADRIRRERMEKRAHQQAQAEAQLTRKASSYTVGGKKPKLGEDAPLVGNLIGEDHVNYVLMYNMLTGIRIGVSRCQAKPKRPLTPEDFTAAHKYSFDIIGNELTPSAKYDFKFKDYAPWVFRALREDQFHLDPADYLLSLTSKYILSELGSPGKSGSFFYFSRDYRFIIKTIHHREHKFLLQVLQRYYEHVRSNPHTLLSRFYGLHRVKLPHGRKIHFVIMNNLFPPHRDVHATYDLKGSTVGREWIDKRKAQEEKERRESQTQSQVGRESQTSEKHRESENQREKEKDKKKNPTTPVLKDLNWIKTHQSLELGPEKRALLTEQLRRDKEMLKEIRVMDYSLLVGIHNMKRGNRDQVRRKTLRVFEPELKRELGKTEFGGGKPEFTKAGGIRELGAGDRASRSIGPGIIGASSSLGPSTSGGVGGRAPLTKSMSMNVNAARSSGSTSQDVLALRRAMRESDPKPFSEKEVFTRARSHGRSLSTASASSAAASMATTMNANANAGAGSQQVLPTVKIEAALGSTSDNNHIQDPQVGSGFGEGSRRSGEFCASPVDVHPSSASEPNPSQVHAQLNTNRTANTTETVDYFSHSSDATSHEKQQSGSNGSAAAPPQPQPQSQLTDPSNSSTSPTSNLTNNTNPQDSASATSATSPDQDGSPLPELDLPITMDEDNRAHFLFYQDEGGLRATDEQNRDMEIIYYLGVIDILTPYNGLKKVEHFWKGLSADRHKISPVPPTEYAERFFKFMKAIMRGGSGGEDFV